MMDPKDRAQKSADDRRGMKRIQTLRDVIYSRLNATGPIHEGLAVDMSAGGMRIQTRYPVDRGTEVNIELKPRVEDGMKEEVIILRGRVVHVIPLDDGEFAMGVKLILKSGARAGIDYAFIARVMQASGGKAMDVFDRAKRNQEKNAGSGAKPVRVRYRSVRKRSLDPRRIDPRFRNGLVLFVVAGLAAWWLWPERASDAKRGYFAHVAGAYSETSKRAPEVGEQGSSTSMANRGLSKSETCDAPNLPSAATETEPGVALASAPEHFERVAEPIIVASAPIAPDATPTVDALDGSSAHLMEAAPPNVSTARFRNMLARADEAAARSETSLARVILDRAGRAGNDIPEVWREAAKRLQHNLDQHPANSLGPMDDGIEIEEQEVPAQPLATDGAPFGVPPLGGEPVAETPAQAAMSSQAELHLEVDRANFVLNVKRGEETLRSFAVGLGLHDATPTGEFRIANKITDPDWYNRGDVVPAGDPKNPLGRRWMGLGFDGVPTSYGIHPTEDFDSIGQPASRGCIRMWPVDAETLFRLCPVGTPVRVVN